MKELIFPYGIQKYLIFLYEIWQFMIILIEQLISHESHQLFYNCYWVKQNVHFKYKSRRKISRTPKSFKILQHSLLKTFKTP